MKLAKLALIGSFFFSSVVSAQNYNAECCKARCLPPSETGEAFFPRCKRIFGNIEFLYWTVEEGALDYSVTMGEKSWAPIDSDQNYATGNLNKTCFDFEPGVRLMLGYYNAPDFWEVFAEYTYYKGCGNDSSKKPIERDLYLNGTFPQLSDAIADLPLAKAKSSIDLSYQLFDVLFSRVFDPNPHLRMRLIGGVTSAFINQHWSVKYFDKEKNETRIHNDWCYNAGGLRVGISSDWWWLCNMYLTAKFSIAGFAGHYENKSKQHTDYEPEIAFDHTAPVRDLHYKDYRYVQHMQFILGPSFQSVGKECCMDYELFIGYELNGWFNLQEVYRSTGGRAVDTKQTILNTGALALHGLTMRLTLGY